MKKVLYFTLLAVIGAAILSSCKSEENTPEAVAEKYVVALNEKKWDEAKSLGTEQTGKMVDMMKSFSFADGQASKVKEFKDFVADVTDDKAVVRYQADGKEEKLNLIKKDGKWLVDMKKVPEVDEALNEVGEKMGEAMETVVGSMENALESIATGFEEGFKKKSEEKKKEEGK